MLANVCKCHGLCYREMLAHQTDSWYGPFLLKNIIKELF